MSYIVRLNSKIRKCKPYQCVGPKWHGRVATQRRDSRIRDFPAFAVVERSASEFLFLDRHRYEPKILLEVRDEQ